MPTNAIGHMYAIHRTHNPPADTAGDVSVYHILGLIYLVASLAVVVLEDLYDLVDSNILGDGAFGGVVDAAKHGDGD